MVIPRKFIPSKYTRYRYLCCGIYHVSRLHLLSAGDYLTDASVTNRDHDTLHIELEDLDSTDQAEEVRTGCLPCCSRHTYGRGVRIRATNSGLTPEEEGAFLLQCDHLSRT